jgi:hypothetical protein
MYGCGLKVSEVCALKWADVDCSRMELTIRHGVAAGTAPRSRSGRASDARQVAFSSQLLPLLAKGRSICLPDDYIFRGSKVGDHLSSRMAEYVLRRAVESARIDKPVCGMSLRHTYAVHRLQDGATIRDVQTALGLGSVHSAMIYLRCAVPIGATSPLEALADGSGKADALAPAVPEPDRPEVLPFEPLSISIGDRARLFYRSLKLHIRWRFMALRNAINTT